jgi:transcriptional regulator with XRE-family HTH domain
MIDQMKTGAIISRLRKQHDWTQSQLAEQLNVTHQAVSRWESGITFPDLAILANIARLFNVKVDDLLYGETTTSENDAPSDGRRQPFRKIIELLVAGKSDDSAKILENQPDQIETLIDIAPLAQPSSLKEVITHMTEFKFNLKHIEELAPYLDSDTLKIIVDGVNDGTMDKDMLGAVAPHLKAEDLDRFADQIIDGTLATNYLEELAPFLRHETLDRIVDQLDQGVLGYEVLEELAPHLSKKTLSRLVARYQEGNLAFEHLVELGPFLDKATVDELIESRIVEKGDWRDVEELFAHASKEKIGNLLSRTLDGSLGEEWLTELAPYLDRRALNELVRQKISRGLNEE